jgi:hypothetical protein
MSPSATIAPIHEVSVAQVVRGIPPGSTAVPQSVVERGAAPTRAFLSGALLESHRFSSVPRPSMYCSPCWSMSWSWVDRFLLASTTWKQSI